MESLTISSKAERGESHRACSNCSRAKARCVLDDPSSPTCQRCNRLNKFCEPNPVREKAQPRKRKPLQSTRIAKFRVEKLEEKLDDLVTLLKFGQENANAALLTPPESAAANLSNGLTTHQLRVAQNLSPRVFKDVEADKWDERLHNGGTVYARFGLPNDSAPLKALMHRMEEPPPYQYHDIDLGIEDPDVLLNIYRNEMHCNFPFVVIPDSETALDLRRRRPTLYTAMMAITTRNSAQQQNIGRQFIQQVAERVHMRGERNLDLLLGILTYAGWCYFHFYNVPRFTSLISSATTIVADMRLNAQGDQCIPNNFYCAIRASNGQDAPKDRERNVEDRRAFLGYWYLTSSIAGFFRRLDRPTWSTYCEECCQVLDASKAHRGDITAVQLIRIQLLGDKIYQSPWHVKHDILGSVAPPVLYLKSFQNELKELMKSQCAEVEQNDVVLLSYQAIEVLLHKTGLSKAPILDTLSAKDFNRIESLFACQQAIQRFFDIYLGVDVKKYHCWSVPIFTLLAWSMGILQLLSTFEHPSWDSEWAKGSLTFVRMADLLIARYSQAKVALGLDPHTTDSEDMFSHIVKKLQWIKAFHEGKFGGPGVVPSDSVEPPIDIPDFMQGADFGEMYEDEWMQDLLGSWEY